MGIATFMRTGHPPTTLRGLMFLAFNDVAVIQSETVASDSGGGGSTTWRSSGTTECRVADLGGNPRLLAGRIDERSTHQITAPEDAVVSVDDRVVVAGRGTFQVVHVSDSADRADVRFEVFQVV